jgi:hypothetical protein
MARHYNYTHFRNLELGAELTNRVSSLADKATTIVTETVDKYAHQFHEDIINSIPLRRGELRNSFFMVPYSSSYYSTQRTQRYGYAFGFRGQPQIFVGQYRVTPWFESEMNFRDLAFILNNQGYIRSGASDIAQVREQGFISAAVSELTGINEEINERWQREKNEV